MKGLGKDDATVQAVVCWASPASVALYGQMLPANMADLADAASTTDAARSAHLPLPHLCPEDVAAELEACLQAMGDATAAGGKAPSGRKAKKRAATPGKVGGDAPSAPPCGAGKRPKSSSRAAQAVKAGGGTPAASSGVLARATTEGAAVSMCGTAAAPDPTTAVVSLDVGRPYGSVDVDTAQGLRFNSSQTV